MGPSAPTLARAFAAGPGAAPSHLVPLHEAVCVLLEWEVVANLAGDLTLPMVFVVGSTARDGACALAGLDPRVVAHPAHSLLLDDAPEMVVQVLEAADDRSPSWDR